jgi:glycosyltransferase involved in cell wall biosynthesis
MTAILAMKLFRRKYFINLDGEQFITPSGLKSTLKRFFLRGADGYLCAGLHSSGTLAGHIRGGRIYSYSFGSLTRAELAENRDKAAVCERNGKVLVVGQYFDYKGMDIALEAARLDPEREYIFVGMGGRTELFERECNTPAAENVTVIPFLQKDELERYYTECSLLVLPSRQECWGLVVGEAASFGMPIVSTKGSGAALEFISDIRPEYLAEAGDAESLAECIKRFFDSDSKEKYSLELLDKAEEYSIEENAEVHLHALGI